MKRAILVWLCVAGLVAMGCSPPPDSFGSVGTLQDSWIAIWDWYDLDAIRNDLSGSYVLMTDLDSSTAGYEELAGPEADDGNGWQPIAPGWWEPFYGTLDGQGYEIRDLFIHRPGEDRVALFDCVTGVIQDVGLAGVNIRGSSDVAGLVGENNKGTITNCYSSGEVSGGWKVGGLVGWNSRGTVRNSSFAGSVTGDLQVGGLVGVDWGDVIDSRASAIVSGNRVVGGLAGNNNRGSVRNSYFTGSVTGNEHVGGLIGSNEATVGNSYSTASVTGGDNVGGLVGRNWFHGTVRNSYSSSTVTGENTVGGLVGHNDSQGDVSNSYATGTVTGQHLVGGLVGHNVTGIVSQSFWDIETSGTERSGGGMGKTTAEMKDIDTFLTAGWDIEMTAEANPTDGYPFLAWQLGSSPIWYISAIPTVTTQAANDVTADSATINMKFTVGDYSPVELRFSWREVGQDWETTNWVSKTESGTHGETITGLDPGISYEFRAQLRYNGTVIDGATLTFITALEPVPTYALTISSTEGGEVTAPGEGTYLYAYGTVVNLVAAPVTGHQFVNWAGDVSTVGSVGSAETTIIMNDDYSILANFEPVADVQTECVESQAGTGEVCFTTSHGFIEDLTAIPALSPAPRGVNFPHGMFEFKITGLAEGETVTLTIELPEAVPVGTVWWKHDGTGWYSLPNLDDTGDNIMVIELTEGGLGDTPGSPSGEIHDPGGPGNPMSPLTVGWEGSSVNKAAVIAPWIALLASIAGASFLILRRRQTQS